MRKMSFWGVGVMFLTGCVPTIGSQLAGKPELGEETYPDINTVPFGAEAEKSRQWHGAPENVARHEDNVSLTKERLALEDAGDRLRSLAGLERLQSVSPNP